MPLLAWMAAAQTRPHGRTNKTSKCSKILQRARIGGVPFPEAAQSSGQGQQRQGHFCVFLPVLRAWLALVRGEHLPLLRVWGSVLAPGSCHLECEADSALPVGPAKALSRLCSVVNASAIIR